MNDQAQRREYFRITYPLTLRPKILVQKKEFEVIDLSEKGVRFLARPVPSWAAPKTQIAAEITFSNKQKIAVAGEILRVQDDQVIVKLTKGIPYAKIMEEQRFILQKHGSMG